MEREAALISKENEIIKQREAGARQLTRQPDLGNFAWLMTLLT